MLPGVAHGLPLDLNITKINHTESCRRTRFPSSSSLFFLFLFLFLFFLYLSASFSFLAVLRRRIAPGKTDDVCSLQTEFAIPWEIIIFPKLRSRSRQRTKKQRNCELFARCERTTREDGCKKKMAREVRSVKNSFLFDEIVECHREC